MAELHRLRAHGAKGYVDLILTETHLDLEPSEEWLNDLKGALSEGREEVKAAPGVIGWIAGKAIDFASNYVNKILDPLPLQDVEYVLQHDQLALELKGNRVNLGALTVDPTEGFIFYSKFREAKNKLTK